MNRRLRLSGLLIVIGLAIQLATLLWNHPLSFLTFLLVGSPIVFSGIVVYLYSLVFLSSENPPTN
jgi:hypothetical protein